MPLWKNTQHSFAAGQLDTHVMGRQDLDKYARGATLLKNFLVKRQGCISKRRGTDLTANLDGLLGTTSGGVPIAPNKMRLVPVTNGDDGRYLVLSGGVGFVASRDGILTSDNRHVRSIRPYVAQDQGGKPIVITGKDVRYSTTTPVDVIRRLSSGSYKVRRYATLQAAFDAAKNNDTVRLHCNLRLESTVIVTPSSTWKTDGGTTATVTWDGDHDGHPNQYKIVVGGSTYYSTESDYYGNRSAVTYTSGSSTVTVTRSSKNVTLDLYGYKLTISTSTGIAVRNASVSLTVDSTRVGGKVVVMGSGSNTVGFHLDSRSTGVRSGALHLLGDIEYDLLAGPANHWIVSAKDTMGVVIDAGTFTSHDLCHTLVSINGGALTVNDGRFLSEATGNNYVHLITTLHDTGVSQATTATINGGEFVNPSSYYSNSSPQQYTSFVFCNRAGTVVVNGGRFTFASPANFCAMNAIRGQNYWPMGFIRIVRGEFSQQKIKNQYDSAEHDIIEYTGDSGDTASRTATQIWFSTLNLTATSGSWSLSDAGSLSVAYETVNNKWHVWGTRAAGGNVNEYADGSPAATEVEFPTSGITATRVWTFSDGGSWQIDYSGGCWNVTTSVLNDQYPNADGFYGIKVAGEGEYTYDPILRSSIPYRFAVPYADDDLADLCIRQSGDTLFIAHRDYPPAKIYFDIHGWAYFEELRLDNTDYQPPVIESAVMVGNEPKETDNWPDEFPRPKATGDAAGDCITVDGSDYYVAKCPSWLNLSQKQELVRFRNACLAIGTVTDAGYNGNTADGDDSSYTRACSYTCTYQLHCVWYPCCRRSGLLRQLRP